jgi:hypothetical protein
MAVSTWAGLDVDWSELNVTYRSSTVLSSATSYPLSIADYKRLTSLIRLYDPTTGGIDYIDVIRTEQLTKFRGNTRAAYITGNQAIGYTLNLGLDPDWRRSRQDVRVRLLQLRYEAG